MENKHYKKFKKAQRRVAQIKSFYRHILVFVIFNAVLLFSKGEMTIALLGEQTLSNSNAMNWIDWNIYIWGGILVIHALFVFGNVPSFVKKWEQRQIINYMNKDNF